MDMGAVHQTIHECIDAKSESEDSLNSLKSQKNPIQVGQERVFEKWTKYGSSTALIDKLLGEWEPPNEIQSSDVSLKTDNDYCSGTHHLLFFSIFRRKHP